MARPTPDRLFEIGRAFQLGATVEDVVLVTQIDPWFLTHVRDIALAETALAEAGSLERVKGDLAVYKRRGISDRRIATLVGATEEEVRQARLAAGLRPVYKRVDTCAAEFEAKTPYMYSTYEHECEAAPTDRKKVMILGGGPNRIGQGIEFDYCCVHAVQALRADGYETIMVNCNPETVSTDYDTADRLYFEPLTREDVLSIIDVERPDGVIVQFGGQTPLRLAVPLEQAGVKLFGTSADAIDRAEDRERFGELVGKLGLRAPRWGIARKPEDSLAVASAIGYPVMVRPSYVLGGRAMETVYDERSLRDYLQRTAIARGDSSEHPVLLVDEFLRDAVEVDIDVVADATGAVIVGGIMEHIEEAGIHSGDSACALPPYTLAPDVVATIAAQARALARELGVVGLMNAQFAVQDGQVYILEVNPRASRTVPFVSKATGVALAQVAARVMVGRTLAELGITADPVPRGHVAVKESVFPFVKFPGVDPILGPEMRSTGEVMGIDAAFPLAFAKAQLAAGNALPTSGRAFVSVKDGDKDGLVPIARSLVELGFRVVATRGTAAHLAASGLPVETTFKVMEGRPHCVDEILSGTIALVVNTTGGAQEMRDSFSIRRSALQRNVSYFTTLRAARAAADGIRAIRAHAAGVRPLQEYHQKRSTHV